MNCLILLLQSLLKIIDLLFVAAFEYLHPFLKINQLFLKFLSLLLALIQRVRQLLDSRCVFLLLSLKLSDSH